VVPIETISKGKKFDNIEEYLNNKGKPLPGVILKWIHRNIQAEKASYLVIAIFGLIYVALIIVAAAVG